MTREFYWFAIIGILCELPKKTMKRFVDYLKAVIFACPDNVQFIPLGKFIQLSNVTASYVRLQAVLQTMLREITIKLRLQ